MSGSQRSIEAVSTRRPGAAIAALLGANLWAVTLAVPLGIDFHGGAMAVAALLAPPVLLALGLVSRSLRLAQGALLVAFPLAVGLGVALLELGGRGVAESLLEALSFAAYLAAAALRLERAAPRRGVVTRPFDGGARPGDRDRRAPPVGPSTGRRFRRGLVHLTCVAGALCLAVVAPTWDGDDARALAFGPSADAASVLVTVVGAILGLLLLGGYLAPATRAERRRPRRGGAARAAVYVLLAAAGGALFALAKL
jgi:hypothetical protein